MKEVNELSYREYFLIHYDMENIYEYEKVAEKIVRNLHLAEYGSAIENSSRKFEIISSAKVTGEHDLIEQRCQQI